MAVGLLSEDLFLGREGELREKLSLNILVLECLQLKILNVQTGIFWAGMY